MAIPNRLSAFPREQAEIREALDERRRHHPQDRHLVVPAPEAAEQSFAGAFQWALGVLWQDQPGFLVLGILCGIAAIIL